MLRWWYFRVTGASTMAAATASGAVSVNDESQSTDTSTGALIVAGGVAVAKNCNVGGTLGVTGASTRWSCRHKCCCGYIWYTYIK